MRQNSTTSISPLPFAKHFPPTLPKWISSHLNLFFPILLQAQATRIMTREQRPSCNATWIPKDLRRPDSHSMHFSLLAIHLFDNYSQLAARHGSSERRSTLRPNS